MFNDFRDAISQRGYTLIVKDISPRHRIANNIIMSHIGSVGIESMTDSDGVQQFIYGVLPCDSSVRVGHIP